MIKTRAKLHELIDLSLPGAEVGMHDFGDQNYGVKRAAQKFCNGKYKIHELIEDGKIENIGAYFINK